MHLPTAELYEDWRRILGEVGDARLIDRSLIIADRPGGALAKECRRLSTRSENLAVNSIAIHVAGRDRPKRRALAYCQTESAHGPQMVVSTGVGWVQPTAIPSRIVGCTHPTSFLVDAIPNLGP